MINEDLFNTVYADSDNGSVTSDDDIGVSAEGAGTSVHGAPEGLKFEGARGDDAGHIAKTRADEKGAGVPKAGAGSKEGFAAQRQRLSSARQVCATPPPRAFQC